MQMSLLFHTAPTLSAKFKAILIHGCQDRQYNGGTDKIVSFGRFQAETRWFCRIWGTVVGRSLNLIF